MRLARLFWPLLALLIAAHAFRPLLGADDLWGHAAIGRWIVQNGGIPRETLFLWSAKQPWIAHSWLSALPSYFIVNLGEVTGARLALACVALGAILSFGLLWKLWARMDRITLLTPILFVLAVQASRERFLARPELVTAVFTSLLLCFLVYWNRVPEPSPRMRKAIWGLPLLFALWVNLHGGVAIGLELLVATVVLDLIQDRAGPRARQLALTALLCAAAILINPYGWHYLSIFTQPQSATFALLEEWKPLWGAPALPPEFAIDCLLLLVVALAAWGLNPRRRWADLAWLLILAVMLFKWRRILWMFSLVVLAVIAANASSLDPNRLWRAWRGSDATVSQRKLAAWAVLVVVLLPLLGPLFSLPVGIANPVSPDVPHALADFLVKAKPRRLLNGFNQAPYLEWRLGDTVPVYIDHVNAYPESLVNEQTEILSATANGLVLLDERGIDAVTVRIPVQGEPWPPLKDYLENSPQWQRVYLADDGVVWRRR